MTFRILLFGNPTIDKGEGPTLLQGIWSELVLYMALRPSKEAASFDLYGSVYKYSDQASPLKSHAKRSEIIGFNRERQVWCFADRKFKDHFCQVTVETDYEVFLMACQNANRNRIDDAARRAFLNQALELAERGPFLGGREFDWAVEVRESVEKKIAEIKKELQALNPADSALHPVLPPSPPANFVGRDGIVRTLVKKLTTDPLPGILLYGGPGLGKTALSLTALWEDETIRRFANRRYWVDAAKATDTATLLAEIAIAIDLPEQAEWDTLYAALRVRTPCVLVIDNIETTLQRDRRRCNELLARLIESSEIALLCCYRGTLGGAGTFWHHSIAVQPLSETAAMTLFANTAGRSEWGNNEQVRATVLEIDCIPLCIILLAYRAISDNTLDNFRQNWKELRLRLLSPDDETSRERNWEICLEASLTNPRLQRAPDSLRLARIMGQLPDGVAESDLLALTPEQSADTIRTLESVGLVYYDALATRYRMLHPVREYFQVAYPPDFEEAYWKQVEAHYLNLLEREGPQFGFDIAPAARKRLLTEINNFCSVLLHASEDSEDALWRYGRLIWGAARGDAKPIVKATESADTDRRLRFTLLLGAIYTIRSESELAIACYKNAVAIAEEKGDDNALGDAFLGRADLHRSQYNDDEALEHYARALDLYSRISRPFGRACCLTGQAHIFLQRSEFDRAWANYNESSILYDEASGMGNHILGKAACNQNFGEISFRRHNFSDAEKYFKIAYDLYGQAAHEIAQGDCLKLLGIIAFKRENIALANTYLNEAAEIFESSRAWDQVGQCLYFLSVLPNAPAIQLDYAHRAAQLWTDFLAPERVIRSQKLCELYLSVG